MKVPVVERNARSWGPLTQFVVVALCLLVIIGFLFRGAFRPGYTVASNDGPLGVLNAQYAQLPDVFKGNWDDLNWAGIPLPTPIPDVTQVSNLICKGLGGRVGGPVLFSKIYAPLAVFFVGISAWLCFRQWRLGAPACLLAALAAALNSDFFSTACWGVASQPICFGFNFLALAALARIHEEPPLRRSLRILLAGCAVGLGVAEAFDIGALFSGLVAVFVIFHRVVFGRPDDAPPQKLIAGAVRVAGVAVIAGLVAFGAVQSLLHSQIKTTAQKQETPAEHWSWATQWSLPKREVLSLFISGLFGYRMDTPEGGNYWGAIGRGLGWDRYFAGGPLGEGDVVRITSPVLTNLNSAVQVGRSGDINLPVAGQIKAEGKTVAALKDEIVRKVPGGAAAQIEVSLERPPDFIRYSGGGIYAGVLVVLVGLWTAAQAFRKNSPFFSDRDRRFILFWVIVAFIAMLLGFGRFAPFYQIFYALPGVGKARNPAKFFHIVNWAFIFLFAWGIDGLARRCMDSATLTTRGITDQFRSWWKTAAKFDRNTVRALIGALAVGVIGWLVYASSKEKLIHYLQEVDFEPAAAEAIARFSFGQVFWFVVTLAFAVALLVIALSGYFSGSRWRIGTGLLGLLLVLDLGRSNVPWVITYDYEQKYASNPILDFLRDKAYLHRVSVLQAQSPFNSLYEYLWKQHLFQYYDIQSLDVIMLPRPPIEYAAFEPALRPHPLRRWQLTNNRYLLAPAGFLQGINQQLDPVLHRFRIVTNFDLALKPGVLSYSGHLEEVTAAPSLNGQYALFEFPDVLPRAMLFSNWQVVTNDSAALQLLASDSFDPMKSVLLDHAPQGAAPAGTNQNPGTVDFVNYDPRKIVLRANAATPSILLLNDKYDADWKAYVDSKATEIVHANFAMRGVFVAAGSHQVVFHYQPSLKGLYLNILMWIVGIAALGFLTFQHATQSPSAPAAPANPPPNKPAAPARK